MSTTTTAPQTFAVGDLVTTEPDFFPTIRVGTVFKIEKAPRTAREKNYVAKPANPETGEVIPGARGVRAPAYALRAYDPANPTTAGEIPFIPTPDTGAVFEVNGHPKIEDGTLFVSWGPGSKDNSVKAAKLGGDNGGYWPSINLRFVTEVPLSDLAARLTK